MCLSQPMMRVSEPILDMDMGNYSEVLDPTYTTLEFDTMQILYNSNGEFSYAPMEEVSAPEEKEVELLEVLV